MCELKYYTLFFNSVKTLLDIVVRIRITEKTEQDSSTMVFNNVLNVNIQNFYL